MMAMSGEQRLKIALDICKVTRAFTKAGIRSEHPDWSEEQINRELVRLAFFPRGRPSGF